MLDFLWKPPIADTAQIIFHVLNAAFFIAIFPVAAWLAKTVYFHFASKRKKPTTNSFLLLASACLVLCVACLRFCTFLHLNDADENTFELIANSLLHGLKTLAVDDDFVGYLDTGKAIVAYYFPQSAAAPTVYGILYCLANILTPVFGGAFLFNAIMKFLPKLRLRFSFLKKQYYFSELNERSLALAKSVAEQKYGFFKKAWQKPILVFTDTYVDEDSERSNELYQAAKRIGAICLNDDIVHFHVPSCREKWFFLMDENEIDNIHALAAFAAEAKPAHIKGSQVFVFYQNDAYALTEKKILDSLDEAVAKKYKRKIEKKTKRYLRARAIDKKEKQREKTEQDIKNENEKELYYKQKRFERWRQIPVNKGKTEVDYEAYLKKLADEKKKQQPAEQTDEELKACRELAIASYAPVITRVRDFENMIFLLLRDHPLFEPLLLNEKLEAEKKGKKEISVAKEEKKDMQLNVTILGSGRIGMQMLLSSSWCGQIYGHSLGLNMISIENEYDIQQRILKISPEFLKSTIEKDPLLRIFENTRTDEYNAPYFTFRFATADLDRRDFAQIECKSMCGAESTHNMLDSDYYLVALGSDEQNISTAEQLARSIAVHHKSNNIKKNVVIVMMVFDPKICRLFENSDNKGDFENSNIHIIPYGSLDSVYSIGNITLVRDNPNAIAMNRLYSKALEEQTERLRSDRTRQKKVYDAWSSLARSIHLNYRVYSVHRLLQDDFFCSQKKVLLTGTQIDTQVYDQYCRTVVAKLRKPQEETWFEKNIISRCREESQSQWELFKKKLQSDYTKKRLIRLIRSTHLPEKTQDRLVDSVKEKYRKKGEVNESCISVIAEYMTWLEHRRWNAYVRSIGFICNDDLTVKDMSLKLHNCLVECGHAPFCKEWDAKNAMHGNCADCPFAVGCLNYDPHTKNAKKEPDCDWLDIVGFENSCAYKVYDRPDDMESDLEKNIAAVNKILNRKKT